MKRRRDFHLLTVMQQEDQAVPVPSDEAAPTAAAPEGTSSSATGFKQFVARRKESLVNLVRRSSSSAALDSTPTASPLFGRKAQSEPVLSPADAEADAKALVLKQGPMSVLERKKVSMRKLLLGACVLHT